MRIAHVYPTRRTWPKSRWLPEAFAGLGHDMRQVLTMRELHVADAECDLLVFEHKAPTHHIDTPLLAKRRQARWCQVYFDLVCTDPKRALADQPLMLAHGNFMRSMDIVFVKERSMLDQYQALGVNAVYLDQACPANYPAWKHRDNPESDVMVFGSSGPEYRARRSEVRRLVTADRHWLALGAGACVIRLAKDYVDITFSDRDERQRIGDANREHVMRHHTYQHRARSILENLK